MIDTNPSRVYYIAIVLDEKSIDRIYKTYSGIIPENWKFYKMERKTHPSERGWVVHRPDIGNEIVNWSNLKPGNQKLVRGTVTEVEYNI